MGLRRRKSERASKYNRYLPALILTVAVLLFTVLGIAIGLYNRRNQSQGFYERIPGIDLTAIDSERRTALLQELNRQACICGCEMTLARCRNLDPSCQTSIKLAREVTMKLGEPGL